jgi:7-cyano-7-deazaguanine reductase
MLESKSLKLFLHSFRNHGSFHERVIDEIGRRLCDTAKPKWLRVAGLFYPRGGIPIDVFWQRGEVPKGVWIPDLDFSHYGGR